MTSQTPPSISVHQLSLYNTGRMSPEQVIAAFAARQQQLHRILGDLTAEKPRSRAQHHLIVGQRGMGKTMMLARIAAELRTTSELAARFVPLVFAEEQYAVDRLSKFWLNCLDALADARELVSDTEGVAAIDTRVAQLTAAGIGTVRNDQPFADHVYHVFEGIAKEQGQRPVLLVDNLQLVFERLDQGQQHSLRELLMRPGSPILVGASPSPPPETQDYGAAFYDHFKIHYLRPLEESEMRDLLLHLAAAAQRDDVRQRVLQHPARIKVLRQLTGGNPRTTLTLFFLYAEDFAPSVFGDLEGLLDRVTPLYKARFEELTAQQQVIASAVANNWDPVTAARVAAITGLPATTISAQLDRLERTGFVERTDLFGDTRTGYQLAERFFNVWFLMRSASRRQRRDVEFLTRFLQTFYEPAERTRLARQLMCEERFTPDRYVWARAVAASLKEAETAEELSRYAVLTALREEAGEARATLREMIDLDSLPPETVAFDDLRRKLASLVPDDADMLPQEFARAVLGDRRMFASGERERLAVHPGKLSGAAMNSILDSIQESRSIDERNYGAEPVAWFSQRIAAGQLRGLSDAEDWNRAFSQAPGPEYIRLMVDTFSSDFAAVLNDTSIARIRSALQPAEGAGASEWYRFGVVLHVMLGRYSEAETAYRQAIAADPSSPLVWSLLADVLAYYLQRYAEAETAYREAIALDRKSGTTWVDLGDLLTDHLERHAEAETAYREAINCDPEWAWPWKVLGDLLADDAQRYVEAEDAYRQAIARDPKSAASWVGLGDLFAYGLQRHAEAENAYREAIACDSKNALAWNRLGDLLVNLQRYTEAEAAYREAISCDPESAWPWNGLGNLLAHLDRNAEAENAYRESIARDSSSAWPWVDLGDLLAQRLGRYEDSETAYREAVARDPRSGWAWASLGRLLANHLQRHAEAEAAFREAIACDPESVDFWAGLGNLLAGPLRRYEEAETVYREAIARDPKIVWPWVGLGMLLDANFGRYTEAEAAFREGLARDPNDSCLWDMLGNLYCDHLNRPTDAANAFDNALQLDTNNESAHQNRLFLRRDFLGEGLAARPLMDALRELPRTEFPDTTHLHEALFAAYASNWGLACESLAKALSIRSDGFRPENRDDWLRASAVLLHLNYGAELLAFIGERGDIARLRPWVEALRAHQIGDRGALRNVAPEIRTVAETLYDEIEMRLRRLPDSTRRRPIPKPARARAKRR